MLKQARGNRQAYLSNCLRTYSCVYCRAHLANHDELISKQFLGTHGPAYLFNSVVNVGCGPAERRALSTGLHVVADIYCDSCKTTLGWKYEQAFVEAQKYKEGKYIIELAHMLKENDWDLTSYNANSIFKDISNSYNAKKRQHSSLRYSYYNNNHNYYKNNNYYQNNRTNEPIITTSSSITQPQEINNTHQSSSQAIPSSSISPSSSSALSCSPSSSEVSSSSDMASSLDGHHSSSRALFAKHLPHIIDDDDDDDDDEDKYYNNAIPNSNNIDGTLEISYSITDNNSQDSNGDHFYDCYSDNDIITIDDNLVMTINDNKNNADHTDDLNRNRYEDKDEDDSDDDSIEKHKQILQKKLSSRRQPNSILESMEL